MIRAAESRKFIWALAFALACTVSAAGKKTPKLDPREAYLTRLTPAPAGLTPASPGSLWPGAGGFTELSRDYKARQVGDIVQIVLNANTVAANSGTVSTNRSFSASSGVSALAGQVNTAPFSQIFSPQSSQVLNGKSSAASNTSLTTTLAGQVIAVLPGGTMVVEAERHILMNNQHETVVVRGLVRPGDVQSDNSVASTALGNLEVELKGRGVLSDGVRPPNPVVRLILRIVGF
jgi:flagellar L-ring protein precursor FlgH